LVVFQGVNYRVRGMQNLGTRVPLYDAPKSTIEVKHVEPCKWRKGICELQNAPDRHSSPTNQRLRRGILPEIAKKASR
jgi:hypothetical protein